MTKGPWGHGIMGSDRVWPGEGPVRDFRLMALTHNWPGCVLGPHEVETWSQIYPLHP